MSDWARGLVKILEKDSILVFAGLAKNVGKTTALNAVNAWFVKQSVGLTSIGYDGEAKDALYGHAKPSVRVYPGHFVLTAERFLKKSSDRRAETPYKVLEHWGNHAQYGSWQILEALEENDISMAGPSSLKGLEEGIQHLKALGARRIHVDGALDRLSHLLLDKALVVLSTGATVGQSFEEVTTRTSQVLEYFNLPVVQQETYEPGDVEDGCSAFLKGGQWHPFHERPCLIEWKNVLPEQPEAIYYTGAMTDSLYLQLRKMRRLPNLLYVNSPAQLLLSTAVWGGLKARGIQVYLRRKPRLAFVTLSPWHPISPVPTEKLAEALIPVSSVPLVDIIREKVWLP